MAIRFPRINLRVNMQGLAQTLRIAISEIKQPSDMYEMYNTAVNPKGYSYWASVNYGTGVKRPKNPREAIITFASRRTRLGSSDLGQIRSFMTVAASPPMHMLERTLPLYRKMFSVVAKRAIQGKMFYGDSELNYSNQIKVKSQHNVAGAKFERVTFYGMPQGKSRLSIVSLSDPKFWVSVMEDCLDYAITMLAKFTPVIDIEYRSEGYTPEPGLLRSSYVWKRITRKGEFSMRIESRTAISTRSKKRAIASSEKLLKEMQNEYASIPARLKKHYVSAKLAKSLMTKTIKNKIDMERSTYTGTAGGTSRKRATASRNALLSNFIQQMSSAIRTKKSGYLGRLGSVSGTSKKASIKILKGKR